MSLAGRTRRPHGIVLRVTGAVALVLGILGMHFLPGVGEIAGASTSMAVMATSPHPGAVPESACSDCAVADRAGMSMSMACQLALLLTPVVLLLQLALGVSPLERLRRLLSVWRARVASLPLPAPPSLLVLSISRI